MIRRLARIVVRLLACLGALVFLVSVAPPRWYARILSDSWPPPKGKVLIALGGSGPALGLPGENSYWRSVYTVSTWREGGFEHVILSGDEPTTSPMRDLLISQGVPAGVIVIEGNSKSTRENALFTVPIAKQFQGPYVLVTSDYHMWRARRAFRNAGLEVVPCPFGDVLKEFGSVWGRWPGFLTLVQETVKIGYYWARRWI